MLNIFCLELHDTNFNKTDERLLRFISNERRETLLKYHFEVDRRLSLYSALLTRMSLSKYYGIPSENLLFSKSKFGKPYLVNKKRGYFNFSHTRNCILLCITEDSPVGADIEFPNSAPFEISNNVFHIEELNFINSLYADNKTRNFYTIWTKKEAYLKKCGTGLQNNLYNVNTLSLPVHFYTFHYNDYICTVCSDITIKDICINTITPKDIYHFFINDT